MNITIATPSDYDVLAVMWFKMQMENVDFGSEIEATPQTACETIQKVLGPAAQRGEPILIARTSTGLPVGCFCAVITEPIPGAQRSAFAYGMYVEPHFRRSKVCSDMLRSAYGILSGKGIHRLYGTVLEKNNASRKLLESMGVKVIAYVTEHRF